MDDGWAADVGADPRESAGEIGRAREAFLGGGPGAALGVREVVARSWRRSALARVDQESDPPVALSGDALAAYRTAHPLAGVIGLLRDLVGAVADPGEHIMAVSDAAGRLLWVEGHRAARDRAERMNFVEGALWDEAHAGTNAPGTALALDHEVQIFAAEHFRHSVRSWTCAAAPIHDVATGQIVGVVDVTGGDALAHPHSLALVKAAARAAELALGRGAGTGMPERLLVLGRNEGVLVQDGREIRLNRRHSELMMLLALHPEGLTGEQLAEAVYDLADSGAVRVELARLRRLVGDLLLSRPYRLARRVTADFLDVAAALRRDDVAGAVAAYGGPLLPCSDAPAVRDQRRWLDLRLRSAMLTAGDPRLLAGWADRFAHDDLQVWERLQAVAPSPAAAARVAQLRAEYGLPR